MTHQLTPPVSRPNPRVDPEAVSATKRHDTGPLPPTLAPSSHPMSHARPLSLPGNGSPVAPASQKAADPEPERLKAKALPTFHSVPLLAQIGLLFAPLSAAALYHFTSPWFATLLLVAETLVVLTWLHTRGIKH